MKQGKVVERIRRIPVEEIEVAIDLPFARWAQQCHVVSLDIVKAELWPGSRVARGFCKEVQSQHSWIVLGGDCYAPNAPIIDPTLWSYDDTVTGIWYGSARDGRHVPHGAGSIWDFGRPQNRTGQEIKLAVEVSAMAQVFLEMAGPEGLDRDGWAFLAHAPVQGWPAGEILAAMHDTPSLRVLIPVDRLGMLTDRNPQGLYLPEEK